LYIIVQVEVNSDCESLHYCFGSYLIDLAIEYIFSPYAKHGILKVSTCVELNQPSISNTQNLKLKDKFFYKFY
jgi:hypothetical protein